MLHQDARLVKALVVGHSHLGALRRAYEARQAMNAVGLVQCEFIQALLEAYNPPLIENELNPAIHERLVRCNADFVVSMIAGNDHNLLGLVNHPVRFDFVLPNEQDLPLDANAAVIPFGLMRRTLALRIEPALRLLGRLRALSSKPFFHFESPPPIPSEAHIKRHPAGFGDLIEKLGVAPATLRYKLWRLHSQLFKEACDRLEIRFVEVPRAMQDERGMLISNAWNVDETHANEVYGERIYRQILRIGEKRILNCGVSS